MRRTTEPILAAVLDVDDARRPTGLRVRRVYLFADRECADAFLGSALLRTVESYPHFTGLALRRFEVDETATRRTQPGLAVVAHHAALTVR